MPALFIPQPGTKCPACGGACRLPATGQPCPTCQGTGLGSKRPGGRGAVSSSPNQHPMSRSAGLPTLPAGTGLTIRETPLPLPPAWPVPPPAGPYQQETSQGEYLMVQTFNNSISVVAAPVRLLGRNEARKAIRISNPSTTLTIFVDFLSAQVSARSAPIFPLGTLEMWVGYKEYLPKNEVWAMASGAGPTLVNVLEFS